MNHCGHDHHSNHDDALHGVHDAEAIEQRLQEAEVACSVDGSRLTPLRREVLSLILSASAPLGAYDLLAKMKRGNERSAAPPTVYRTLDFLMTQGFIHRLASINAYIPCCHPRAGHQAAFLICQKCQTVQETSASNLMDSLNEVAQAGHFTPQHTIIEISGLCQRCHAA